MKVHVWIAHQGIASRRAAEKLVGEGKVKVNGVKAHIGQQIDPVKDQVIVQGKKLPLQEKGSGEGAGTPAGQFRYFLVYKPVGYVSTTSDELERPTVLSLLPKEITNSLRLYPVGRLDLESEGLVLLTNDGDLTFRLTHPRFAKPKTYFVLLNGDPTDKSLDHLRRGVKLKEGFTHPAEVEVMYDVPEEIEWYLKRKSAPKSDDIPVHSLTDEDKNSPTWISLTITEGRNHQVRRMCERVGYFVKRLIRTQLGPVSLADLGHKAWVELPSWPE